jgi:hypothetical protein
MNRIKKWMACFVVVLTLGAFTSFENPQYVGTWKLNIEKSDLGEFGQMIADRTIVVEKKDNQFILSRTRPSFDGSDYTTKESLNFDGKETESTVWETAKKKSVFKWSEDKKSFTVTYNMNFEMNGNSMSSKGTENWKLSEDGKTLTLLHSVSSDQWDFEIKGVYEKQ